MNGSPPRVRVKLIFFPLRGVFFGITPACAGKTEEADLPLDDKEGSPPRVRVKPATYMQSNRNQRITPACAGKTLPAVRHLQEFQDHPRVCG